MKRGGESSKKIGWDIKISLAFEQRKRISSSVSNFSLFKIELFFKMLIYYGVASNNFNIILSKNFSWLSSIIYYNIYKKLTSLKLK